MDGYERAKSVAHYRLTLLIKAHVDDAANKASETNARRQRRRSAKR